MRKHLLFLIMLFSCTAFAQQDILFTQYMYNKLELNPAYAGSQELLSLDLLTRIQWVGIPGAPRTYAITAHTPLKYQHIGVGFDAYREDIGPTVSYGIKGSFAYRLIFPSGRLSFGVAAGIKYFDIDWSALNAKDGNDFELSGQVTNKVVPDVDFGVYYYSPEYYAGVSSKHLVQSETNISGTPPSGETGAYTKLLRHFYAMAGGVVPLADNIKLLPSVLFKYVKNAPFQADLTANFMLRDILTIGVSYRTESAIGLIVGVNATRNLTLGYSYDIWFNGLRNYNQGSHEIHLGYGLDVFNKDRMLSPRYF